MQLSEYVKFDNSWKIYLRIKVTPKQPKTELFGVLEDGTLKIRIKAIPEKWRANEELIKFISKELNLKKEQIEIISWASEQIKIIRIRL